MPDTGAEETKHTDSRETRVSWIKMLFGAPGVILALVWGIAEGTLFFVVPDVVLSLVAMLEPRRVWRHILAAALGGVIAGALLFDWSVRKPEITRHAVASVPFVAPRMFSQVRASYQTHGIAAVFAGPLSGIPYKIYAVEAPAFVRKATFLVCTAPARAERFLAVCLGLGIVGLRLRRRYQWNAAKIAAVHAFMWVLFYTFYWGIIVYQ